MLSFAKFSFINDKARNIGLPVKMKLIHNDPPNLLDIPPFNCSFLFTYLIFVWHKVINGEYPVMINLSTNGILVCQLLYNKWPKISVIL